MCLPGYCVCVCMIDEEDGRGEVEARVRRDYESHFSALVARMRSFSACEAFNADGMTHILASLPDCSRLDVGAYVRSRHRCLTVAI